MATEMDEDDGCGDNGKGVVYCRLIMGAQRRMTFPKEVIEKMGLPPEDCAGTEVEVWACKAREFEIPFAPQKEGVKV